MAKADGRMFQERHSAKAIESLGDERSPSDRAFQEVVSGIFYFTPKIAEMIQFYEYVSTVLKPPITFDWKGSI